MDLVYQSFLAFMVFAEAIAVSKGSADGLLLIARTPLILACLHNGQYPFFFLSLWAYTALNYMICDKQLHSEHFHVLASGIIPSLLAGSAAFWYELPGHIF